MSDSTRAILEQLYSLMLSAIILLARALDKPSPVITREQRRQLEALQQRNARR